jgi:hypothetical protein
MEDSVDQSRETKTISRDRKIFTVAFLFCALFQLSCERATQTSNFTLDLKSMRASNKVGALAGLVQPCSTCLKHVVVNVDGPGIPKTIVFAKSHPNFQEAGTELDGLLSVSIPAGADRKIQILGAYVTSGTVSLSLGEKIISLAPGEVTVPITITERGILKQATINGRFLDAANVGPSGWVDIQISPVVGAPAFTLMRGSIMNGWFSFFSSSSFPMTYKLADGRVLLKDLVVPDAVPAGGPYLGQGTLTTSAQVAVVLRPAHYRSPFGANDLESAHNMAYGFFGPGVSANQRVCKAQNDALLPNTSSVSGANLPLGYSSVTTNGTLVTALGGVPFDNIVCFSGGPAVYTDTNIELRHQQFNGLGNDNASGMTSLFSNGISALGDPYKYKTNDFEFRQSGLPGIFGAGGVVDALKVFKPVVGEVRDEPSCEPAIVNDLTAFTPVTAAINSTLSGGTVGLNTEPAVYNESQSYLVCPSKAGQLLGYGGVKWKGYATPAILRFEKPSYSLGTLATLSPGVIGMILKNRGGVTSAPLPNTLTWTGAGGFSAPSGNCQSLALAPGAQCTYASQFLSSTATGDVVSTVSFDYTQSNGGTVTVSSTASARAIVSNGSLTFSSQNTTTSAGSLATSYDVPVSNSSGSTQMYDSVQIVSSTPEDTSVVTGGTCDLVTKSLPGAACTIRIAIDRSRMSFGETRSAIVSLKLTGGASWASQTFLYSR